MGVLLLLRLPLARTSASSTAHAGKNGISSNVFLAGGDEDKAKNPEVLDKNGSRSGLMGGPPLPPASPATGLGIIDVAGAGKNDISSNVFVAGGDEDKAKNPEVLDKNGTGSGLMGGPPLPPPPPASPDTGLGIINGDASAGRRGGGGICRKRELNFAELVGAGGDGRSSSVASLLTTLGGHRKAITGILVHAHVSNKLFSGSWDGTIRVWDIITWQCVQVIELGVPVACLARECGFIFAGARGGVHGCRLQTKAGLTLPVTPAWLQVRSLEISGSTLFAGVEDGTVLAWKAPAPDGCCVDHFGPPTAMLGHTSPVLSLLAGGSDSTRAPPTAPSEPGTSTPCTATSSSRDTRTPSPPSSVGATSCCRPLSTTPSEFGDVQQQTRAPPAAVLLWRCTGTGRSTRCWCSPAWGTRRGCRSFCAPCLETASGCTTCPRSPAEG